MKPLDITGRFRLFRDFDTQQMILAVRLECDSTVYETRVPLVATSFAELVPIGTFQLVTEEEGETRC